MKARGSANALAARAITRGGTGNRYWNAFTEGMQDEISMLGGEINSLLFTPSLQAPIKTLDVPLGGPGYGPKALPFVFDLVNVVNRAGAADARNRRVKNEDLPTDEDGTRTVDFLKSTRSTLRRLCSNHPSSLGLHPALYFYAKSGTFQSGAMLVFVELMRDWTTDQYKSFTRVREDFEAFLMKNRGHTEAVRRLGSSSTEAVQG